MDEISCLKINESQIPIKAYKSILDNYIDFLKFFYGNEIDLVVKEGSQIFKAIKKDNIKNNDTIKDFDTKLRNYKFDKRSYAEYQKPLMYLNNISKTKEKHNLQDFILFFNQKDTIIDIDFKNKLEHLQKSIKESTKPIKELTSIIGSIHLIADRKNELEINVIDKLDNKTIKGMIKTNDKESDKKLFNDIRVKFYGKTVLVSGYLERENITFNKKYIEVVKVTGFEQDERPLHEYRGILK